MVERTTYQGRGATATIVRWKPTAEQEAYAYNYTVKGIQSSTSLKSDFKQAYTGMLAEVMIDDLLGLPRPQNLGRCDGGFDLVYLGKRWDVKGSPKSVPFRPHWNHNLNAKQARNSSDGYIFYSYDTTNHQLEVCGWALKGDALRGAILYPEGSVRKRDDGKTIPVRGGAMFEVPQASLKPWTEEHGWSHPIEPVEVRS